MKFNNYLNFSKLSSHARLKWFWRYIHPKLHCKVHLLLMARLSVTDKQNGLRQNNVEPPGKKKKDLQGHKGTVGYIFRNKPEQLKSFQ